MAPQRHGAMAPWLHGAASVVVVANSLSPRENEAVPAVRRQGGSWHAPPRGHCSAMASINALVLVRRRLKYVDRTACVDKLEDDNEKNPEEVSKTKILIRESLSLGGR